MAKVSKNQRLKGPQPVKTYLCPKGHTLTWVYVAVRGRKNMRPLCECSGYKPITIERS